MSASPPGHVFPYGSGVHPLTRLDHMTSRRLKHVLERFDDD